MIVEIGIFWFVVAAVVGAAAWLAEDALRAVKLPTRWAWLTALWAPPILLLAARLLPSGGGGAGAEGLWPTAVFELPGLEVGSETAGGFSMRTVVGILWLGSVLAMIGGLVRSQLRLRKGRAQWPTTQVRGAAVHLSDDVGPAVSGVLRPWIVIPRWALELPAPELDLVLLHEKQHLAGQDTRLLALALCAVGLAPWNPLGWWQLRRLRTAVEVDCDRRVLRESPDVRPYGTSLLRVAAQNSGVSLGLAAFAERPTNIKRRILAMTHVPNRWSTARALASATLALALVLVGCSIESPVTIDDRDAETAAAAVDGSTDIRAQPSFTPFTVAPSILNRDEVIAAMVAEYPPLLRDAGIGGTVRVYFFINESGRVEQVRIDQSSRTPSDR